MASTGFALTFSLLDLSEPADYPAGNAYGVNNAGEASVRWLSYGYKWDGSQLVQIDSVRNVYENSINNLGHVAGYRQDTKYATFYDGTQIVTIGNLGGSYMTSRAHDVNDSDVVVGKATDKNNIFQGYWWQDGEIHALSKWGGGHSGAYGVNDLNEMVGYSATYPVYWNASHSIERLPGLGLTGGGDGTAYEINNLGEAVGNAETAEDFLHAVIWQRDQSGDFVITDLGTLGGEDSRAYAINDSGWIVGDSQIISGSGVTQGFVYTPLIGMVNANDLLDASGSGYVIKYVHDVSDTGILGATALKNGRYIPVLLTPDQNPMLPEPASIVFMASGLAAVAGYCLRRRASRRTASRS